MTVTRGTLALQAQIVSYLTRSFSPEEIRIEPLYANLSGEPSFKASDAAAFASGFLAAREKGKAVGVRVTTSITRPSEIYGPYCNVLRQVLNLVPGNVGTACFLESRPKKISARGLDTACFNPQIKEIQIHEERVRSLVHKCSRRPAGCDTCLCSFQCTYGCPDRCILDYSSRTVTPQWMTGSFRCRVNKILLDTFIRDAARIAWSHTPADQFREVRDPYRMLTVMVCGKEANSKVDF